MRVDVKKKAVDIFFNCGINFPTCGRKSYKSEWIFSSVE